MHIVEILNQLKENGDKASFIIGNKVINGFVIESKSDNTIIKTIIDEKEIRYLLHPNNVVIVERRQ